MPFIFSNVALMGIFLLQFLMKAADRIIGKGLDTWVIIQLVVFNLAWMVVLVVPMAVLIATLMAFGSMSQSNEITIMKASGMSLPRMIWGPAVCSLVLVAGLIYFNNNVLPDANHQAKVLMFDISQKKPTLSLRPGVFSQEMNNCAILARDIDQQTNIMRGVTIYDYSNPTKTNIITAKTGKIYFTPDVTKLLIDLQSGEIHESDAAGTTMYRRVFFEKHRIAMGADQFSLQHSRDIGRGDRELSSSIMMHRVDSLKKLENQAITDLGRDVNRIFYGAPHVEFRDAARVTAVSRGARNYSAMIDLMQNQRSIIANSAARLEVLHKEIDRYMVEIHKKYAIPVACIIFVLLGAPLGVMTRKGGFGMAGSISVFFFLIYWAFLIGGEKLADRDLVSPFWGMWSANFLMGALGLFLLYRSVKETVTINFDFVKNIIPKRWRKLRHNEG